MLTLAILAVFTPLIGFVLPMLLLQRQPRAAQAFAVLCSAVSFVAVLALYLQGHGATDKLKAVFLISGGFQLEFGFLLDGFSRLMGLIVALITLCIQVYSLGYMAHDPARTRYFSMLGFFAWSMLSFVFAINLLQVFIFWELVGLASFFLIGFWFEKPSAAAAAKKAMIMTRVGDIGFYIGMALLLREVATFDIPTILDPASGLIAAIAPGRLTLITLLIFIGIMGKSAQFPLHTWLPSAMEGPTPVSALLHSATMVAAGVFLFIRLYPLMAASHATMTLVLMIATFTMILSSTIAMVERDIKRVLAYSSISQLSFMLMGLAAGGLFAGFFHLTTHAFFKALLFLCAGAYIHHYNTNEMAAIGQGGGRKLRGVTLGLIIGGCALAGLPPLSGFFSKEMVMGALHHDGRMLYLAGGLLGAFLTAYYTLRMIFLVTRPAKTNAAHGHDAHHGVPGVMLGPILVLTTITVVLGFFGTSLGHGLQQEVEHPEIVMMVLAVGLALAGVLVAWLDFGRARAARVGFIAAFPPLRTLFENAWYVDQFYAQVVTRLVMLTARICELFETRGMDGSTDGLAEGVAAVGGRTARLQVGWLQVYLSSTVAVVALFLIYLGLR
jgi:NADH-quinone oxidoreductase subunit L